MDGELYFYFVTALSVLYAVAVRLVQRRLMNPELMKDMQEKSKRINELYKEAAKHNDKRKMDEITKMNEELMPQMNKMLMGQMKMMVAVLAVFFAFTWVSGQFDPTQHDDFTINLTQSGNGSYSGSYALGSNATPGFWYVTARAYNGESEAAMNQTVFFVGPATEQLLWNQSKEAPMGVSTDKCSYSAGETVFVSASAPATADRVAATLDNGTRFYVDLPFTIPLLNLRRIYDSQSWFIFSAVIIGLLVNPIISFLEKSMKKQNEVPK